LPLEEMDGNGLSVQRFFYGERDVFQNPTVKHEQLELTDDFRFKWGCFSLLWDGKVATTGFNWSSWHGGAPEPKVYDSRMGHLDVEPDEWVRLRWRGRFSDRDCGMWWYEHTCINVARFEGEPNARVFLDSEPSKQFTHLPHLR
jgi:hypothetical protein